MICEWFCQSEGDSDDETDGERKALRRVRMCSGLFGSVRARLSPGEQHGRWSSRPAALSLSAVVDCTAPAFCWGCLVCRGFYGGQAGAPCRGRPPQGAPLRGGPTRAPAFAGATLFWRGRVTLTPVSSTGQASPRGRGDRKGRDHAHSSSQGQRDLTHELGCSGPRVKRGGSEGEGEGARFQALPGMTNSRRGDRRG